MQIMLNQDEIEESIRNHVLSQLAIREDQEISIEFRAGRGENSFTATLDVRNRQTGATHGPRPASAKVDEARHGPRLVEAESQKEDKTGISTRKAEGPQKPTAPRAPKKGIFATAPNAAAEPTEVTNEAEPGVPDQETPAEGDAREDVQKDAQADAQDGNEAPAEQSAEQPGARKSIFTFAPKTSAG